MVIRLIGRNSRLSLLQIERVKKKIEESFPEAIVQIIARSSRGDALQDIPLQTVEGSDFFTQDIFEALNKGEADIAVHSLKDMSSKHFFGNNQFAVVERDDVRDVAIFNNRVQQKIKNGQTVIIGTCSPRREQMAIGFLQKALPQLGTFTIETRSIRGNIDTRLKKLDSGEFDGIILATAGLNRLLKSDSDALNIQTLLKDKKLMILPLIECVPAPCQGAIVAEAHRSNQKALNVLKQINERQLMEACVQEKRRAMQYGAGCLQKFGVTTINSGEKSCLYAAGENSNGEAFNDWWGLPRLVIENKRIFNSADYMGNFFDYSFRNAVEPIREPVVYIANHKGINNESLTRSLQSKRIWAAGSRTWLELAKQGVWVEGCADAFGLESLEPVWSMPLLNIQKNDVRILTHEQASTNWEKKGWKTRVSYALQEKAKASLSILVQQADLVFWTSYQQYEQYKTILKKDVVQLCSSGETAELLRKDGVEPVVFPNIQAFQQWRKISILSRDVA